MVRLKFFFTILLFSLASKSYSQSIEIAFKTGTILRNHIAENVFLFDYLHYSYGANQFIESGIHFLSPQINYVFKNENRAGVSAEIIGLSSGLRQSNYGTQRLWYFPFNYFGSGYQFQLSTNIKLHYQQKLWRFRRNLFLLNIGFEILKGNRILKTQNSGSSDPGFDEFEERYRGQFIESHLKNLKSGFLVSAGLTYRRRIIEFSIQTGITLNNLEEGQNAFFGRASELQMNFSWYLFNKSIETIRERHRGDKLNIFNARNTSSKLFLSVSNPIFYHIKVNSYLPESYFVDDDRQVRYEKIPRFKHSGIFGLKYSAELTSKFEIIPSVKYFRITEIIDSSNYVFEHYSPSSGGGEPYFVNSLARKTHIINLGCGVDKLLISNRLFNLTIQAGLSLNLRVFQTIDKPNNLTFRGINPLISLGSSIDRRGYEIGIIYQNSILPVYKNNNGTESTTLKSFQFQLSIPIF